MESDFAYAVKAQAQPATALPLERLSPCVDRIERLTYLVNKFIERFYNGPSEESGIAAFLQPSYVLVAGFRNDSLSQLRAAPFLRFSGGVDVRADAFRERHGHPLRELIFAGYARHARKILLQPKRYTPMRCICGFKIISPKPAPLGQSSRA